MSWWEWKNLYWVFVLIPFVVRVVFSPPSKLYNPALVEGEPTLNLVWTSGQLFYFFKLTDWLGNHCLCLGFWITRRKFSSSAIDYNCRCLSKLAPWHLTSNLGQRLHFESVSKFWKEEKMAGPQLLWKLKWMLSFLHRNIRNDRRQSTENVHGRLSIVWLPWFKQ